MRGEQIQNPETVDETVRSFTKVYLWRAHCVQGTVLGAREAAGNRRSLSLLRWAQMEGAGREDSWCCLGEEGHPKDQLELVWGADG